MKKKLFLLPFLLITWILNSGFLFKPNIKVVTCGDEDYIANITLEDEKEILGDYPWIFDSKSGQIYAYDQNKNTLKPVKKEIFNGAELTYINNYVKGKNLYVDWLERDLTTNKEIEVKAILDFNNMKVTFFEYGQSSENVCKEITLPKNIRILK